MADGKFNWVKYAIAWIKYAGAFLTHVADIGELVRRSFDDIHVPKKEEFYG